TGRTDEHVAAFRSYYQAQGLFGMPRGGELSYSQVIDLDLASVEPSVSGPRRPQDRIPLPELGRVFRELLSKAASDGGYGKPSDALSRRFPTRIGVPGTTPEKPLVGGGKQEAEAMPAKNDTNPATAREMGDN